MKINKLAKVSSVALILSSQGIDLGTAVAQQGEWVDNGSYEVNNENSGDVGGTTSTPADTGTSTGSGSGETGSNTGSSPTDTGGTTTGDTISVQPVVTGVDFVSNTKYVNASKKLFYRDDLGVSILGQNIDSFNLDINGSRSSLVTGTSTTLPADSIYSLGVLAFAETNQITADLLQLGGIVGIEKDVTKPVINFNVDGTATNIKLKADHDSNYFSTKPSIRVTTSDLGSGLSTVSIKLNGNEIHSQGGTYDIDLDAVAKKVDAPYEFAFEITATDNVGNTETFTKTVYYSNKILDDLKFMQEGNEFPITDGKLILEKGEKVSLSLQGYQNLPFKKLYLVLPDGNKSELTVTTGDSKISTTNEFTLSDGKYKLIGVLDSDVEIELLNSVDVLIDAEKPVINSTSANEPVMVGGVPYHTEPTEYTFDISDDKGLKSVTVSVNGSIVSTDSVNGKTHTAKVRVSAEGITNIVVVAVDNAGKTTTSGFNVGIDTRIPNDVTAKVIGEFTTVGNNVYSKEPLNFEIPRVNADDKLILYKDNTATDSQFDTELPISLYDSFEVKSKAGNSSGKQNLYKVLFGLDSPNIIVDNQEPTANINISGSSKVDIDGVTYYADKPTVKIDLSDNGHINSYELTVNGVSVKNFNYTDDTSSAEVEVPLDDSGSYDISLKVTDRVGLSTTVTQSFKVDMDSYDVSGLNYSKPFVKSGEDLIFAEPFELSVISDNKLLDKVKVFKDGSEVGEFGVSDNFEISGNGNYEVQFVSVFGKTGQRAKLGGVLTEDGKDYSFYFDTTAPDVQLLISDANSDYDNKKWFTSIPTTKLQASDDYMLKGYEVHANGQLLDAGSFENGEKDGEINFKIPADVLNPDGSVKLELVSIDMANVRTTKSYTIYLELEAPVVTGISTQGTYHNIDKTAFTNSNVSLDMVLGSQISGYKALEWLDANGNVVSTVDLSINGGNYTIDLNNWDSKGVAFRFVNNLEVPTSSVRVADYLNGATSLVVDTTNPVIDLNIEGGSDINGSKWFNSIPNISTGVSDSNALRSARVTVNGTEVLNKDYTNITKDDTNSIDFSKVTRNSDGSYNITVEVMDGAGNTSTKTDTFFVDDTAPVITNFNFIQEGYKPGQTLTTNMSSYGFFFQSATTVDISVSDEGASGGISSVEVTFRGSSNTTQTVDVVNGIARVTIPNNFKGFISAVATDRVGNKSSSANPDGVITEDSNWSVSTSRLDIGLPATDKRDSSGNPLYNTDFTATGTYSLPISGLRSLSWLLGGNAIGSGASSTGQDLNLNVAGTSNIGVSGNTNGMVLELVAVDNAGHTSRQSATFSIDKDAPVISVEFGGGEGTGKFYKAPRTMTVTIRERNFRASDVVFNGNIGGVSWTSNGDVHTGTVTFGDDGVYSGSISYTDMAGNAGNTVNVEEFIIDRTAPVATLTWDNNIERNGFFKEKRTATITVRERNFNSNNIVIEGARLDGGWLSNGDVHTATITFDKDGTYQFSVSGTDSAGNNMATINVPSFRLDSTPPVLNITGVSSGASYTKDVKAIIEFSDDNIDISSVKVELVGVKNGKIELKGSVQDGKFVLDNIPDGAKYDDVYTLIAEVSDLAGNTTKKEIKFMVNRHGSTYKWVTDTFIGEYIREVTDGIVLEETSVTKIDTSKTIYTIQVNGKRVSTSKKPKATHKNLGDGIHLYRYTFPKEIFEENGLWTLGVSSTDEFGKNSNSYETRMEFILDSVAPTVAVGGVDNDGVVSAEDGTFTVSFNDNIKIKSVKYILNGSEYSLTDEEIEKGSINIKTPALELNKFSVVVEDMTGQTANYDIDNLRILGASVGLFTGVEDSNWFNWLLGIVGLGGILTLGAWIFMLLGKKRKEKEQFDKELDEIANSDEETSTDLM